MSYRKIFQILKLPNHPLTHPQSVNHSTSSPPSSLGDLREISKGLLLRDSNEGCSGSHGKMANLRLADASNWGDFVS